ncbi:MAG: transposase [Candidatus Methylomirabilota bacterium]
MLGETTNGVMRPNEAGKMAQSAWDELTTRYTGLQLDSFVVMPNHVHGIIVLSANSRGTLATVPAGAGPRDEAAHYALGDVVGGWKSLVTHRYIHGVRHCGWHCFAGRLWQRNYYEHIIRNEEELFRIRRYIADNPVNWGDDSENPNRAPDATGSDA